MKFLNIDVMGKEYEYSTADAALDMSNRLPFRWKAIALPVAAPTHIHPEDTNAKSA